MSRLEKGSLLDVAEGLQALFRGEDSEDADLGALFLARALQGLFIPR